MAVLPYWFKSPTVGKVKSLGYAAAAPVVLTLLPAGHKPGTYLISVPINVRVAGTGGFFSRAFGFNEPASGAVSFTSGTTSLTGTSVASLSAVIESAGSAAITLTLTPAGVTGSPAVDVYASATLVAPSV